MIVMREVMARRWTDEEQQKLFDIYFGSRPALCPVCGGEVNIVLTSLREGLTLSLACGACGNRARVSRPLKGSAVILAEAARSAPGLRESIRRSKNAAPS